MVAAVLNLDIGAGAPVEPLDQMRGRLLDRHDVVDDDLLLAAHAEVVRPRELRRRRGPCLCTDLAVIADDAIDLGHGGEALGIGLGGASGDDDARMRPLALRPPDRLAGLTLRLGGDRTGVDDDDVGEACRVGMPANHLRLVGVEPATEGEDVDAHGDTPGTAPAANSAGSKRPSNSYSTGPVIST